MNVVFNITGSQLRGVLEVLPGTARIVDIVINIKEEAKIFSVLVADDDESIRGLLREELVKEGYEVETVESGAMAIKKILKKTVDVLILDIHMAGISGIDAIPLIKMARPYLPIITITGDTSVETARKVRAQGIFYYFVKPFDLEEMKKVVKTALSEEASKGEQTFKSL